MVDPRRYPHAALAAAAEASARAWALLVTAGITLALPAVHLTRDDDDIDTDDVGNPAALLSTLPRVVFRSVEDVQLGETGNLGLKLLLLRIGLVVVMVGLVASVVVAVRWLAEGDLDAVHAAIRIPTGLAMLGAPVAVALLCGEISEPDVDDGILLGIDAGGGLLGVMLCGVILLAGPASVRWDLAQHHRLTPDAPEAPEGPH